MAQLRMVMKNEVNKVWNANQFNHYLKYMAALFAQLEDIEAIDCNPASGIKKKQPIKRIQETLTPAQRIKYMNI